jgi:hypothetical protein
MLVVMPGGDPEKSVVALSGPAMAPLPGTEAPSYSLIALFRNLIYLADSI